MSWPSPTSKCLASAIAHSDLYVRFSTGPCGLGDLGSPCLSDPRAAALPPGLTMAERARNGGSPRSRAGELRIERPGNKVIVGGVVGAPARWRRRRFGMTSAWLGVVCHTIGSSSKASLEGHDRWSPSLPSDLPMDCADGRRVGCGGYLPPLLITSVPWRGDRVARRNRPTSIEGAIEMNAGNPASTPRRQLLWLCSRCGLSITPRARWLAIEHCPRCMARAHLPVRLISTPPATGTVHPQRSTLTNRQGARTTYPSEPR